MFTSTGCGSRLTGGNPNCSQRCTDNMSGFRGGGRGGGRGAPRGGRGGRGKTVQHDVKRPAQILSIRWTSFVSAIEDTSYAPCITCLCEKAAPSSGAPIQVTCRLSTSYQWVRGCLVVVFHSLLLLPTAAVLLLPVMEVFMYLGSPCPANQPHKP